MSEFNEMVWIADDPFGGARLQDMDREMPGTDLSGGSDDGDFTSPYIGITHPNNRDPLTGEVTGGAPDYSVVGPRTPGRDAGLLELSDGRAQGLPTRRNPLYLNGDHRRPVETFGVHGLRRTAFLQQQLAQAGLLDQDDLLNEYGTWSTQTQKAAKDLLSFANVNGVDWENALSTRIQAKAQGDAIDAGMGSSQQGTAQAYLAPDYDAIVEEVEATARKHLGENRELRDYEKKLLAEKLGGLYDEQVAQSQSLDDETIARREAGSDEDLVEEEIDASSSYQQFFKDRYGAEMSVNQDREALQANTSNLLRNLTGADAVMGG